MKIILGVIIGFILGFGLTTLVQSKNQINSTPDTSQNAILNHSDMTMNDMVDFLVGRTGDDFDKAFLEGMIVHHEGAVDMAEVAKENALHDEIKDMAEAIINTQSEEISQMKKWQNDWGYLHSEH